MKAKTGGGVAARQGGGFRQGFGHFDEEHLEQEASASAAQQKQLAQQTSQPSAANQHAAQAAGQTQNQQHPQSGQTPSPPPREVGTLGDELVRRPLQDVWQGLKSVFDINTLLGIHPGDTPEEQEKKKNLNHRFQQLTEEQQQVAQKKFQQEMQKKKQQEEEKHQKKQMEEAKKRESVAPPSSPHKGPVGPGGSGKQASRKQMATDLLERDRQQMSRLQTAG